MGKFEVYKDKKGEFRFKLKAGNGQIIAQSEGYSSKAGCENGIESVRKNATEDNFETYEDKRGEYRFRLKARNGETIATGEGYKAKSGIKNGIKSIIKNAADSKIVYLDD